MFYWFILISIAIVGCHGRLVDPYCLQGPASGVNAMACCPIPEFLDLTIVEQCAAAIIDDKDSPMDMAYGVTQEDVLFWPGIRCISQCIMNESKVMVNGSLQVDRAINVLIQKKFNDSDEWLPVLKKAMQTCDSIVSKTPFKKTPDGECSFQPAFFMACVDTQIFQNCPASQWVDEYGCAKLKEDSARCPVLSAVLANTES